MEDFVPFEIAKKLKEKGFREKCFAFYYKQGGFQWNYMRANTGLVNVSWACFNYNDIVDGEKINAPTISQVLKWLREKKKIFIDIRTSIDLNGKEHFSYYIIHNKVSIREGYTDFDWKFEHAAIAGIEYCLDNLI